MPSPTFLFLFNFFVAFLEIWGSFRTPTKFPRLIQTRTQMENKDTCTFTHRREENKKKRNNTVINKDVLSKHVGDMTTEVLRAGRQAGTMLKGVCSWAHKLTHSTDVFWNNTGVNIEHLKTTVQAEEDGSPPLRGDSAGLRSLNLKPRGPLKNCRVISQTLLPEDVSLKARSEKNKTNKTKQKKEPKRFKGTTTTKIQYNHGYKNWRQNFFSFL